MQIADKIRITAKAKGIRLTDISEQLGITQQAFYSLLKAKNIKTDTLNRVAKILGVDMMYFFDNDLSKLMDVIVNEQPIKIDLPEFDKNEKTSENKINGPIFQRSMYTAIELFDLYDKLYNFLEIWETDSNIEKEDILKEIRHLLGVINYSSKHLV